MSTVNTNRWILTSVALIGFIVGYGTNEVINRTSAGPSSAPAVQAPAPSAPAQLRQNNPAPAAKPATADDDPFLGEESAPVTMIEFTDYQCPYCGRHFRDTMPQIRKEYIDTGKVKYVVRDFPLGFHQFAQKAAEASECAHEQGKFWEMHDKLFENQQTLDVASIKQFASDIGLDQSKFDDCLDSGQSKNEINKDKSDGSAAGITGTPGFFINGKKISGAQPFANFKAAIDAALAQ